MPAEARRIPYEDISRGSFLPLDLISFGLQHVSPFQDPDQFHKDIPSVNHQVYIMLILAQHAALDELIQAHLLVRRWRR